MNKEKHFLDEIEWRNYCAFKHIEPQIKGCLDRERELEKQLAEMNKKATALFGVLYEILEKEDPDNVSSRIDYLTKQNNSAISDQYKLARILKRV